MESLGRSDLLIGGAGVCRTLENPISRMMWPIHFTPQDKGLTTWEWSGYMCRSYKCLLNPPVRFNPRIKYQTIVSRSTCSVRRKMIASKLATHPSYFCPLSLSYIKIKKITSITRVPKRGRLLNSLFKLQRTLYSTTTTICHVLFLFVFFFNYENNIVKKK